MPLKQSAAQVHHSTSQLDRTSKSLIKLRETFANPVQKQHPDIQQWRCSLSSIWYHCLMQIPEDDCTADTPATDNMKPVCRSEQHEHKMFVTTGSKGKTQKSSWAEMKCQLSGAWRGSVLVEDAIVKRSHIYPVTRITPELLYVTVHNMLFIQ